MRELEVQDDNGVTHQVLTDGRVVWVNDTLTGCNLGRFSAKGVDVHSRPGAAMVCLDCTHSPDPFGLPRRDLWERFCKSMKEHYGIAMPDGLIETWATEHTEAL